MKYYLLGFVTIFISGFTLLTTEINIGFQEYWYSQVPDLNEINIDISPLNDGSGYIEVHVWNMHDADPDSSITSVTIMLQVYDENIQGWNDTTMFTTIKIDNQDEIYLSMTPIGPGDYRVEVSFKWENVKREVTISDLYYSNMITLNY